MKKILSTLLASNILLSANLVNISTGTKNFSNSASKTNGDFQSISTTLPIKGSKLTIGYSDTKISREHFQTKATLPTLYVRKANLKLITKINDKLKLKTSYIKILDNLAPTDQGKVYGIGTKYNLSKTSAMSLDHYLSDYQDFNVNQTDISISKGYKFDKLKANVKLAAKYIHIDGTNYNSHTFQDKNYFTQELHTTFKYKNYITKAGVLFNKRVFTVLNDGTAVQHHALEQDGGHYLALIGKFKNWNLMLKYRYENGKELDAQRDDVSQKTLALTANYRF